MANLSQRTTSKTPTDTVPTCLLFKARAFLCPSLVRQPVTLPLFYSLTLWAYPFGKASVWL
ncbi:hypothetical protein [Psychrobacter immobilis]|uniref:hypothetical protein n=1 Tax=Psychrobacter immobilis TaxID=498 RepID=UPI003FD4E716